MAVVDCAAALRRHAEIMAFHTARGDCCGSALRGNRYHSGAVWIGCCLASNPALTAAVTNPAVVAVYFFPLLPIFGDCTELLSAPGTAIRLGYALYLEHDCNFMPHGRRELGSCPISSHQADFPARSLPDRICLYRRGAILSGKPFRERQWRRANCLLGLVQSQSCQ